MTDKIINTDTGELLPISVQDPQAQASLFNKLAKVMGNLSRLPKSGHNTHFNYDFVTDSDVSDAVRNALAVEGVAFFAHMRGVQRDDKKVVAHFTYTFADGETGATWSCDWTGEAIDTQDKGTAKAATSALKFFLLKTFILSTGDPADDPDADTLPTKTTQKPSTKSKASDNGTEQAKAAFFARVLDEIPYYETNEEIAAVLKKAKFTAYAQSKEAAMLKALQTHASEAANKEAA